MGGKTPLRTDVTGETDLDEAARLARRRLALLQLVLGVPALVLILFGLVLGYRLAGRALGGPGFWGLLIPVVLVFVVYYGRALWALRRSGRS